MSEMVKPAPQRSKAKTKKKKKTAPMKKARYIYFLARGRSCVEPRSWFVTELDNNNKTRKVDMQYPEVSASFVCFGSYGTLIYGLGGTVLGDLGVSSIPLRSVFFYDTSKPKRGWIQGPSMIATRSDLQGVAHRVVDGKLYVLGGVAYSDEDRQSHVCYPWGEFLDMSPLGKTWQLLGRPAKEKSVDPKSVEPKSVEPDLYLGVHPSCLRWGEWEKLGPQPFQFASLPMLSGKFEPKRHILFYMGSIGIVACYDIRENLCFRFPGCFALSSYDAQKLIVEREFVFAPADSYVFAAVLFGGHNRPAPWFFGSVQDMYRTCKRLPTPPSGVTDEFQLLRIGPCKFATLWYDGHKLRLSVFSPSLDSEPFELDGIRFLPAETHVADQHVDIGLQTKGGLKIVAAVAVS